VIVLYFVWGESMSSYVILSYKIRHNYDVSEFLDSYRCLLQRAVDIIWNGIKWMERRQRNYYVVKHGKRKIKKYYNVERLIPVIPRTREFKRNLRNQLLGDWQKLGYASHYVDSAIKVAYSIINAWRRNYLRGRRGRNKPTIRRKFVRIKKTLYRFKDWKIVITIKTPSLS